MLHFLNPVCFHDTTRNGIVSNCVLGLFCGNACTTHCLRKGTKVEGSDEDDGHEKFYSLDCLVYFSIFSNINHCIYPDYYSQVWQGVGVQQSLDHIFNNGNFCCIHHYVFVSWIYAHIYFLTAYDQIQNVF